jgi:hypothetical protein
MECHISMAVYRKAIIRSVMTSPLSDAAAGVAFVFPFLQRQQDRGREAMIWAIAYSQAPGTQMEACMQQGQPTLGEKAKRGSMRIAFTATAHHQLRRGTQLVPRWGKTHTYWSPRKQFCLSSA